MGGDLAPPDDGAPAFLVYALRDPIGANLDRVQIIKGWVDEGGRSQEQVFDVAWAGERQPGADGRLPPVGNSVNLETSAYANDIGVERLAVRWQDPQFDPDQSAFYYARVLQIPTPRHSLYDAVALQRDISADFPLTLQERAYSSPIWYRP